MGNKSTRLDFDKSRIKANGETYELHKNNNNCITVSNLTNKLKISYYTRNYSSIYRGGYKYDYHNYVINNINDSCIYGIIHKENPTLYTSGTLRRDINSFIYEKYRSVIESYVYGMEQVAPVFGCEE